MSRDEEKSEERDDFGWDSELQWEEDLIDDEEGLIDGEGALLIDEDEELDEWEEFIDSQIFKIIS